jgi:hypothetical protein
MTPKAREKWRPSVGFIIFTSLAAVAALPLVGLFFFRLYDNQLIHQTQAELIAQSRVLAAVYAREVEARLNAGIVLGTELPPGAVPVPEDKVTPIRPALDLTAGGDLLRRRPDALPAGAPASQAYVEIGARLMPIIRETQKGHTRRFPDPRSPRRRDRRPRRGRANRSPISRKSPPALQGQYRAVLRIRKPDKPPPPIYSISRGVGVTCSRQCRLSSATASRASSIRRERRATSSTISIRSAASSFWRGLAVVFATIVIGLVFSRTITRPMRELVDRAARISRGDRDAFQPLAHYGTREFAQLSHSFLDMAEQLARRSDYIATFSAHLTHELKSPLTSIKGAAELLLDSLQSKSDNLTRMEQKNSYRTFWATPGAWKAMTQRSARTGARRGRAAERANRIVTGCRRIEEPIPDASDRGNRKPRASNRHVQRKGADRVVASHRQRHPSQREDRAAGSDRGKLDPSG